MTVIAWDGKTLAADKRALASGVAKTTTKIYRVGECLVGFSGTLTTGMAMLDWWRNGHDPAKFPSVQNDKDEWTPFIVIFKGGPILVYERGPHPCEFDQTSYAMGSGRDFALAAMHLGYGAAKAVEVACALSVECGNGIDALTL